jgi:hypothetical protein
MLAPSSPRKFAIFAVVAAIALAVLGFFFISQLWPDPPCHK